MENAAINLAQEIQRSARPLGEEKLYYLNPTSFLPIHLLTKLSLVCSTFHIFIEPQNGLEGILKFISLQPYAMGMDTFH